MITNHQQERTFKEKICIICSKTYTPTNGKQKYCIKCGLTKKKELARQAKIRFYERKKHIIELFKQVKAQNPDRKVSLEYDVKINNKHHTTLKNPCIMIHAATQHPSKIKFFSPEPEDAAELSKVFTK